MEKVLNNYTFLNIIITSPIKIKFKDFQRINLFEIKRFYYIDRHGTYGGKPIHISIDGESITHNQNGSSDILDIVHSQKSIGNDSFYYYEVDNLVINIESFETEEINFSFKVNNLEMELTKVDPIYFKWQITCS